ncbi:MAG: hypothetical protein FWH24_06540 [Oscillospiraceae bacterium]|nr:hypothetical protein [Oscillospiraceae bacterium]
MAYNDLTFFTNEPERDLYSRFNVILKNNFLKFCRLKHLKQKFLIGGICFQLM